MNRSTIPKGSTKKKAARRRRLLAGVAGVESSETSVAYRVLKN
jgi:hypothetical protein